MVSGVGARRAGRAKRKSRAAQARRSAAGRERTGKHREPDGMDEGARESENRGAGLVQSGLARAREFSVKGIKTAIRRLWFHRRLRRLSAITVLAFAQTLKPPLRFWPLPSHPCA